MWWDTILWLVAIVLFVAVEASTTALVSVWFAVGAAAAMVVSFFSVSLGLQLLVFAIVSAVALGVMVPSLAKHRKQHQPPVGKLRQRRFAGILLPTGAPVRRRGLKRRSRLGQNIAFPALSVVV